jgi:uncharacterized protein YktB (UPF0637 family)
VDDDVRMKELREEISARLKNICSEMSESDFASLVEGIARHARKSETTLVNWGAHRVQ